MFLDRAIDRAAGLFTRSIPRRILAALLSIYLVTYFATAIVVYSGVRASMLESDASALNRLADLKYEQLDNHIAALATDLTAWSALDVMNDLPSGDIDKRIALALETSKRLYRLAGEIYAFGADGKLLASSLAAPGAALADRLPPQWQNAGKALVFIDKQKDPMTGDPIVALSIPVFAAFDNRYRTGTLVLTEPWSAIEKLLFGTANGTALLETGDAGRVLAASPPQILDRIGPQPLRTQDGQGDGVVIGRSASRSGLLAEWQVLLLHDTASATGSLRWVALELALLGAGLGVPIIFLGRWLSYRLTAPIADLTRVVGEIADTDRLDARVPVTSFDELGSLATSFNRMTDKLAGTTREREQFVRELAALNQSLEAKIAARTEELQAAMRAQQRLLGDISHEIKSPLARLSMALGLAARAGEADRPRQFGRIEREVENIAALASELLTLAALDGATRPPKFAPLDIAALLQDIVEDALFEKPGRRTDVVLRGDPGRAMIVGNADLLRRAIENVVRNAIFYTAPLTKVEIVVAAPPVAAGGGQFVAIEVRDHGPGVPDAALPHLFEPFYRVDEARARATGGTGIGLAICRRVIQLHGGEVSARKNEPHGLAIEIDLPCEPGQSERALGVPQDEQRLDAGAV